MSSVSVWIVFRELSALAGFKGIVLGLVLLVEGFELIDAFVVEVFGLHLSVLALYLGKTLVGELVL